MPEVIVDNGEVLVERKIVPQRRDRTGPWALLLVIVFIVTYGMVVFADRIGLGPRATAPASAQVNSAE